MPHNEPVSILLVNEHAEEIKQTTLTFRGFFPNCRIEAVYSLEEAFQWAHRVSWHLILVDERLHAQRSAPIFPELKRFAPYATLVLQTERADTSAALTALQDGADFLLYKKSPAFLTELMIYAKGLFETHTYRMMLERTQERLTRLTELSADFLYELDPAGRFVYLSPPATEILGYTQDELIGAPYSIIVQPDQLDHARYYFNDRRTGSRATREKELILIGKTSRERHPPPRVKVRISAKGLYDSERRYFGTLGLLHIMGPGTDQELPVRPLEQWSQDRNRLLGFASQCSSLAKRLHASCNSIHGQSQLLLKVLREARLIEQTESLATYASDAIQLGNALGRATGELGLENTTVNHIIDAILSTDQSLRVGTDLIERTYALDLPPFTGNVDWLSQVVRTLLSHAQHYIATGNGSHQLRISTRLVNPYDGPADSGTTPRPTPSPEFEIAIQEIAATTAIERQPIQTADDLLEAYALIKQLGGRWDFLASVGCPLSIRIWIPVQPGQPSGIGFEPVLPSNSSFDSLTSTPSPEPFQTRTTAKLQSFPQPMTLTQPLPDRRTCVRTPVNLPTRLTIGNSFRHGSMTDLCQTGASIEVDGLLPPHEQRSTHLIFKTDAGSFEIQAAAHNHGPGSKGTGIGPQTTRLGLQFLPLNENQQKVLASYIDEARARVLDVAVEAIFSPMALTEMYDTSPANTALRGTDHRETMRVRVLLPVRLEVPTLNPHTEQAFGVVVNFSRGGACVHTSLPLEITGEIVALHFSSTGVHNQPRVHEPESPEAILIGRIVHSTTDYTVPHEQKSDLSQTGTRIGIRFVRPVPFAEREINRVIAQHISTSVDLAGLAGGSSIISTRRECRNARHQVIAMTDDHARDQISPSTPILLIVPGFGFTQTDYLPLSYYLAANRFRVLRYDHTNHVGQSDGDILQMTLRGMQSDLQHVLTFVHTTWPTASISILAEDIAARVAVKIIARDKSASRLFLLNPVLDIETALSTPSRPDAMGGYRNNPRRGVANLWGLNVNIEQFIGDAIAGDYTDVASSAADFARLPAQPVILTSPRTHHHPEHIFGPQTQSLRAIGTMPVVIPLHVDVSGESGTCDERHIAAFRAICKLVSAPAIGNQLAPQMREPHIRAVYQQRRLEQERIRIRHHVSQATRSALSVAYLAQLPQFGHLPDYWTLINELHRRLLPLDPGATVIDIGCGAGDFARAMLTNYVYRSSHQSGPPALPLRYIGLDQSHEALKVAQQQVQAFAQELLSSLKTAVPMAQFIETHWLQTDWTSPLPLSDGSINRVLCQLSLPFTPSPLDCLREALRVLHPDGTAIITCFQPHTDLSTLFQRHYRATGLDELSQQAQIVLHFLSRMREAIRHGILHNYERNELAALLSHAGANLTQIYPVLDNQLLLAIVRKGKSTG